MAGMKTLAKQTAIYGVSSILGRFFNWCLAPWYTYVLASQSEFGIYTNIYAWTALLIALLTYGMETGFFRFMNDSEYDQKKVYGTCLSTVATTSTIFIFLITYAASFVSQALGYGDHGDWIAIMGITVAIDAFCCIPLAYLRNNNQPATFAFINLAMIGVNIFFNLFFLLFCPMLVNLCPSLMGWYDASYSVGYVFVANLISTLAKLAMLAAKGSMGKAVWGFHQPIFSKLLHYSLPLLVLSVAGIMNQTLDKILFPFLYEGEDSFHQQGIYGACFKLAMVMMMFTQAFRYAYEPFVFARNKEDKKAQSAEATKFFVIFSIIIILGMLLFIEFIKFAISPDYWEGLSIVPVVLVSYLFQGIYFNLSIWYKLTDRTHFGAYFSLTGLVITLVLNVLLVPAISYMGCALASLACFIVITLLSYIYGQRFYPIPYQIKRIALYMLGGAAIIAISRISPFQIDGCSSWHELISAEKIWTSTLPCVLSNIVLISLFIAAVLKFDLPVSSIPVVGKFFRKK